MAVYELHITIGNHMAVYVLQSYEQTVSCVYVMSKQMAGYKYFVCELQGCV